MPRCITRDGDRQRMTLRRALVDRADLETLLETRKSGDGSRAQRNRQSRANRVQRQKEMIVQRVFVHTARHDRQRLKIARTHDKSSALVDIDAIVDATSYSKYAALADRLRAIGLVEDTTEDAPLCRWRYGALIVDVMPTDAAVLGFSNRWYPDAIETATTIDVAGHRVRIVTPALFIATKLEAFRGRGGGDVFASHDLEDIIAVVDGRPEIVSDVAAASSGVRVYISAAIL